MVDSLSRSMESIMKILPKSFAVFWRSRDSRVQFHGDMFKLYIDDTAKDIADRYARLFPNDIICSIRDGSGRFVAFK